MVDNIYVLFLEEEVPGPLALTRSAVQGCTAEFHMKSDGE